VIPVEDVTLGEVSRAMDEVKRELDAVSKDVNEIKVTLAGFTGTTKEKVDRLEKVVYGTLGVAVAGLITAIVQLVLHAT
jgi:uncharacterized protein YoxC